MSHVIDTAPGGLISYTASPWRVGRADPTRTSPLQPGHRRRVNDLLYELEIGHAADAPRYLVTIFHQDERGLLLRLLTLLDDGFVYGDVIHVKFSIDGSSAAALHGTFGATVVVHAYVDNVAGRQLLALIPEEHLGAQLLQHLDDEFGPTTRSEVPAQRPITVTPFRAPSPELFADRRFSEYRFGSTSPEALHHVAKRFASRLSELHTPIAYLTFPQPRPGGEWWLHIGVGLERAIGGGDARIDIPALELAHEGGCSLAKYDPSGRDADGGLVFTTFLPMGTTRQAGAPPSSPPDLVDAVLVHGPARMGCVASMLEDEATIVGGSMAVLAGHTLALWLLPKGVGQGFTERTGSRLREFAEAAGSLTADGESPYGLASLAPAAPSDAIASPAREDLWVAWRCGEHAGAMRKVLRAVNDVCDGDGREINVEQATSRILASGRTCAGKVKFTIGRPKGATTIAVKAIEDRVNEALTDGLAHWDPERRDWRDQPVFARHVEPAEEPWASLNLSGAAFPFSAKPGWRHSQPMSSSGGGIAPS